MHVSGCVQVHSGLSQKPVHHFLWGYVMCENCGKKFHKALLARMITQDAQPPQDLSTTSAISS